MPILVFAEACPGTDHGVNNNTAFAYAGPANTTTLSFFGTNCIPMIIGASYPPSMCQVSGGLTAGWVKWTAVWSNETMRTMAPPTAGCSFMCGYTGSSFANTCFVRGSDGLPVELMEFGVEE